jgi:hypothetical protein
MHLSKIVERVFHAQFRLIPKFRFMRLALVNTIEQRQDSLVATPSNLQFLDILRC